MQKIASINTSITAYNIVCGLVKLAADVQWKKYYSNEVLVLNKALMDNCKDSPAKHLISIIPSALHHRIMDRIFIPGMTHHFLFRKLYIENEVTRAIDEGVKQVLVIGAGLDTLAIRLSQKYNYVHFFEIDRKPTQKTKLTTLHSINYQIPENISFIPADISKCSLRNTLHNSQYFNPLLETIVIIEGVLMYLDEVNVKLLFHELEKTFTSRLKIIYGAMAAADKTANLQVRMMDKFLGKRGEGTKWYCPIADMAEFMEKLNYQISEFISYKDLQRRYRKEDELLKIPIEDENYYIVEKSN